MSKKKAKGYTPQWFNSPFNHLKYTLIREIKDCKSIGINKKLVTLNGGAASTNYITDGSQTFIVVYMPYSDVDLIYQQGLIVHESVHVWQEVKRMMAEKEPSIEFEAYSIQKISQDLLYLLGDSNGLEKSTD